MQVFANASFHTWLLGGLFECRLLEMICDTLKWCEASNKREKTAYSEGLVNNEILDRLGRPH